MSSPNEPIRINEVGTYGDLIVRPNPDNLAILSIPPFEAILPLLAKRYGRDLTPDEIALERNKAPSIVIAKEAAEQMGAARARRRDA